MLYWTCLILVWFYGILTIFNYLMVNPVFTYISNIGFVNIYGCYTQLKDLKVQFLTIQFSISHLFALNLNVKQFYLIHK